MSRINEQALDAVVRDDPYLMAICRDPVRRYQPLSWWVGPDDYQLIVARYRKAVAPLWTAGEAPAPWSRVPPMPEGIDPGC